MKNVLIIGASILQLPAIKKAKELGYIVGVVDYDPNAIGIKYADKYFNYSTTDAAGIIKAAQELHADGIMTLATDMPMVAISIACEELNLPGISIETAIKATDKGIMMETFEENSVPHPWFFLVSSEKELRMLKDKITYPCILKPTDNSGSRGVILVNNEEELKDGYLYAHKQTRSGNIIVQEYLKGTEVSVELMIVDSNIHVLAITDKITTGAPHFIETGHSQPTELLNEEISQVIKVAKKAASSVGIDNGPAHVEIMVTKNGPVLIEIGARLGGDFITTHLVPLSTGVDMIKAVINQSIGGTVDLDKKHSKASMIKYFSASPGVITDINGVIEASNIKGVVHLVLMKSLGDRIDGIHSSNDRVGFVIIQASNLEAVNNIYSEIIDKIDIVTI